MSYSEQVTNENMIKNLCPCGSGLNFEDCCSPYIQAKQNPATAEQLMRSRYTAYEMCDSDYLLQSWHASTRPESITLQPDLKWLGLKIVTTQAGLEPDTTGVVEFVARNKLAGRAFRLHEISRFVRENGRWYYLDGVLKEK